MPKRRIVTPLLYLFLLIALGAMAYIGYAKYVTLRSHLTLAQSHLKNVAQLTPYLLERFREREFLGTLERELEQGETHLRRVEEETGPFRPAIAIMSLLPVIGPDMQGAPHLLQAALEGVAAARLTVAGLTPAALLLAQKPLRLFQDEEFPKEIVAALQQRDAAFREAKGRLDRGIASYQQVEAVPLSPFLAPSRSLLEQFLPRLQKATATARLAPRLADELLGLSQQRKYLVLAQNSWELRATGGFIAGVWLVTVDRGKIIQMDFQDSATVDDPYRANSPPPEALFKYMYAGQWIFRDANWSPDFPTAAQVAENLYYQGQGVKVDGVLAVDQEALLDILKVLGPIYLSGYGEVSAENFIDRLLQSFSTSPPEPPPSGRPIPPHKLLMKALGEGILYRLGKDLTIKEEVELLQTLERSFTEKHLLISTHNEELKGLLQDNSWDGGLRPSRGDYFLVVDSNVGYSKINPNIQQAIDYSVALDERGGARGRVAITYRNTSTQEVIRCVQVRERPTQYEEKLEGCYWDYARLYVPQGSQLVRATYIPLPAGSLLSAKGGGDALNEVTVGPGEKDKEMFGNFFTLQPGEEKEIAFEYQLPKEAFLSRQRPTYLLDVQKQPGTLSIPLRVTVTLPRGWTVVRARPAPTRLAEGKIEFQGALTTDQSFQLVLTPP